MNSADYFAGTTAVPLLDVSSAARALNVSESWIRRHLSELPSVRLGRLIRFDSSLLQRHSEKIIPARKSLEPERKHMIRYQRGNVVQRGKKVKIWYGKFREDVRTPDGIERRPRQVRLGTVADLPTKNAARNKLAEIMGASTSTDVDITFRELVQRWEKAEGPTMKESTRHHYMNALRAYVLPTFGERKIATINRSEIQEFLSEKAERYSRSVLRSIRVTLSLTLGWAADCDWLRKNPCRRIKLPKVSGGRSVVRTVLTPEQVNNIAAKLEDPYSTLILFLFATGVRIGEAIALKSSDISGNVVTVQRRIYYGDVDVVKSACSVRRLPIDPNLVARLRKLGEGHEWVFRSEAGTPINPGNALKRYIRPVAEELKLHIGGWHDFRHTLATTLRRSGVHPKVVSDILGHKRVNLAMDTYDRTDVQDFVQPLSDVTNLLAITPDVTKCDQVAVAAACGY